MVYHFEGIFEKLPRKSDATGVLLQIANSVGAVIFKHEIQYGDSLYRSDNEDKTQLKITFDPETQFPFGKTVGGIRRFWSVPYPKTATLVIDGVSYVAKSWDFRDVQDGAKCGG